MVLVGPGESPARLGPSDPERGTMSNQQAPPGKHPVYVIRILDQVGGVIRPPGSTASPVGGYVKAFDPDAHDGQGSLDVVLDPADARTFRDFRDAMDAWTAVAKARPKRPDGKPNRPLTAFSVEVIPQAQAIDQFEAERV